MSYKTVLAYLPTVERAKRVLDVAIPIADRADAHLIGVHVIPDVMAFYGITAGQFPVDLIEQQRQQLADEGENVRKEFERRGGQAKAKTEWRSAVAAQTDTIQKFIDMSMCADLIVTDQGSNAMSGDGTDVAARIVLGTSRPVLVVPAAGKFGDVGKRPMIAWNGEKEAARAAFDAIPLMQDAELARILAIDPATGKGQDMVAMGDEMAICLSRHGIKAEVMTSVGGEVAVGDELLNRVSDFDCDLLVMGCYGHSRLREMVFGGASKNILDHMTVPVLMSH